MNSYDAVVKWDVQQILITLKSLRWWLATNIDNLNTAQVKKIRQAIDQLEIIVEIKRK